MSADTLHYKAAVASFIDGVYHFKAISGEHIVIVLGPAQVISAKRDLDRYVAEYEAEEVRTK